MKIKYVTCGNTNLELSIYGLVQRLEKSKQWRSLESYRDEVKELLNELDKKPVHGHRPSEYIDIEYDWNYMNVFHLNSEGDRDRLMISFEL